MAASTLRYESIFLLLSKTNLALICLQNGQTRRISKK